MSWQQSLAVFVAFLSFATLWTHINAETTVLYIPLDERYTTRVAFLNLAKSTPYKIVTPPTDIICSLRNSAPLPALTAWFQQNVPNADFAVISAELFLYGGLISSRISNQTYADVHKRLEILVQAKQTNPKLKILLSSVVMRIPSYNGAFEEPWFWDLYGADIFCYSFYLDKYNQLGNPADLQQSQACQAKIPPSILSEWVWRRSRNFNITEKILYHQAKSISKDPNNPLFEVIYITQDDNAEFGFNIREAANLRVLVSTLNLTSSVRIYPGADEVGFTMLAKLATIQTKFQPTLKLVFRDPSTIDRIPNYEGQPMIDTLMDQIAAAGGIANAPSLFAEDNEKSDLILLVNNFSEQHQLEAPYQPMTNRSIADYSMFDEFVNDPTGRVLGFADNRYSNGADIFFVRYIESKAPKLTMSRIAYAGWNTDGNTLGTVIGNAIVLNFFRKTIPNASFNILRFVEDMNWQAITRQSLQNYIAQVPTDSPQHLDTDLDFYEHWSWKILNDNYNSHAAFWNLSSFKLDSVYYPWNRTFEIGFYTSGDQ